MARERNRAASRITWLLPLVAAPALIGQPIDAAEFARRRAALVPEQPAAFETVPWRLDLGDASREGKLLFIWSMNGHPLGCT